MGKGNGTTRASASSAPRGLTASQQNIVSTNNAVFSERTTLNTGRNPVNADDYEFTNYVNSDRMGGSRVTLRDEIRNISRDIERKYEAAFTNYNGDMQPEETLRMDFREITSGTRAWRDGVFGYADTSRAEPGFKAAVQALRNRMSYLQDQAKGNYRWDRVSRRWVK